MWTGAYIDTYVALWSLIEFLTGITPESSTKQALLMGIVSIKEAEWPVISVGSSLTFARLNGAKQSCIVY